MNNNHLNSVCRLCSGKTDSIFHALLLNKYNVNFLYCKQCESVMTELPYWLDEAYSGGNLSILDTGAVQRNLKNLAITYAVSKLLNINRIVDMGGGDGLLCRLLRDYEIDCYISDKYATPTYSQSFTASGHEKPEMVVAFEVFEHFADPGHEVARLFTQLPNAILLSTELYKHQEKDWWYFSAETGQHVFFYSKKAFKYIAKKYNYEVVFFANYVLLTKNGFASLFLRKMISFSLNKYTIPFIRMFMVMIPTLGTIKDRNKLINKL